MEWVARSGHLKNNQKGAKLVDPLGLGRELLRIVGFLYWGLALVLVCVALSKPKHVVLKLSWAAAVLGIFLSPLFFLSKENRQIKATFEDACSKVGSSIQSVESGSSQFLDYELVWLGRKSVPYETDSIRYMLERKLSVLELTYAPQYWRRLTTQSTQMPTPMPGIPRSPNPRGVQTGIYVRLSLEDAGHKTCEGFQRWSDEFPSQKWPWMQKLGLRTDQCIGIQLVNQLQSQYGIYVERSDVKRFGNNGALEVHNYRLHDHVAQTDLGTAQLLISSAFEHRDVQCGAGAIAKQLTEAIKSTPDPRYSKVDEVVHETKPFPPAKDLTLEELRARGLNFKDRDISFDRSVWSNSRYERKVGPDGSITVSLVGYELVSLVDNRLHRIPLASDLVPGRQGPIAVGAKDGQLSALIRNGYNESDHGVLLEFSRDGVPLRQQLISGDHMKALLIR